MTATTDEPAGHRAVCTPHNRLCARQHTDSEDHACTWCTTASALDWPEVVRASTEDFHAIEAARAALADREARMDDWGACCPHRALQLDRLYEERTAGMRDAARAIEARLRAAYDETGDRGLLQGVAIVRAWAANGPESAAAAPGSLTEGAGHPGGLSDADRPPA